MYAFICDTSKLNMFLYIVVDPEPEIHLDLPADYPPSDTDGIGKAVTVYILECRNVCPYLIWIRLLFI